MALFSNKPTSDDEGEYPVLYLDGSSLLRPLNMPLVQVAIMLVFVIAAAIIGWNAIQKVDYEIIQAPTREAEATQANMAKEVGLGTPILPALIQCDNETIAATFANAGFTTVDMADEQEIAAGGMDFIKLPDGVTELEATTVYAQGLSKVKSSEAVRLLNGSWRMTVGRTGFTDMKAKYADFTSGSIDAAVVAAATYQGFDTTGLEVASDSVGNRFLAGTIDVNGVNYQWSVSSCPLVEIYSIDGVPTTAAYVVIRLHD